MPSLHTAFATLIALFAMSRLHSRWRLVVLAYPAVMGLALVYLGEHYVIDLVAGVGYAVVIHFGVGAWERRQDRVLRSTD
jgi:membrane-associated phospholipid phosphatase